MKTVRLIAIFLVFTFVMVNTQEAQARWGLFGGRGNYNQQSYYNYNSRSQHSVQPHNRSVNNPTAKQSLSGQRIEPSGKQSSVASDKPPKSPAPIYNGPPIYKDLGPVSAVHIEDPKLTIYFNKDKVYKVRDDKTGEVVRGPVKIPPKVNFSILLVDKDDKDGSWQKDPNGAPKWLLQQGTYGPEELNFYAGYNRGDDKDNLFIKSVESANRSTDKAIISNALGSQSLDLERMQSEDAFGQEMLRAENMRVENIARMQSEDAFGQEMWEAENVRAMDMERMSQEAAFGKGLLEQEIDAEIAGMQRQLRNDFAADQALGIGQEAGLDANGRQKDYANPDVGAIAKSLNNDDGYPFGMRPANSDFGQLFNKATTLGIAKVTEQITGGIGTLIGATSQLNQWSSQFNELADQLVKAEAARVNMQAFIAKIPNGEYYDKKWLPVKNMPLTYDGERVSIAATSRNLDDPYDPYSLYGREPIIAFQRQGRPLCVATVWYYEENIGPLPVEHFKGSERHLFLQEPANKVFSKMEDLGKTDQLVDKVLQKVTTTPQIKASAKINEDLDPSAALWVREWENQQNLKPFDVGAYRDIYDNVARQRGYGNLRAGPPKGYSLTKEQHKAILGDFIDRKIQATTWYTRLYWITEKQKLSLQ